MKRRVALPLLGVLTAAVLASHVSWQKQDNGWLMDIDGRPVDVLGWLSEQALRLSRDCRDTQRLQLGDAAYGPALAALQAYSPPASLSARVGSMWVSGRWMLIEAEFQTLLPAVSLLQLHQSGWQVVPHGVWSGQTHPWRAAPLIRRYLAKQVPQAPRTLLDCFELQSHALGHGVASGR